MTAIHDKREDCDRDHNEIFGRLRGIEMKVSSIFGALAMISFVGYAFGASIYATISSSTGEAGKVRTELSQRIGDNERKLVAVSSDVKSIEKIIDMSMKEFIRQIEQLKREHDKDLR